MHNLITFARAYNYRPYNDFDNARFDLSIWLFYEHVINSFLI